MVRVQVTALTVMLSGYPEPFSQVMTPGAVKITLSPKSRVNNCRASESLCGLVVNIQEGV